MEDDPILTARDLENYNRYFNDLIPKISIEDDLYELYHRSNIKDYDTDVEYEIQSENLTDFKKYFTNFENLNFDKILCEKKLNFILFIIDRVLIDIIGDKLWAFKKITEENKNSSIEINKNEYNARAITTDFFQHDIINLRNSEWVKSILEEQSEFKKLLNLIDKKNKSDVNLSFKLMIDGESQIFSNTRYTNDYYLPKLADKLFKLLVDEIETMDYEDLLNSKEVIINPIKSQYKKLDKEISNRIFKIVAEITKNLQYSNSQIKYINWVILAHLCFKKNIHQWYQAIHKEPTRISLFEKGIIKDYYRYVIDFK